MTPPTIDPDERRVRITSNFRVDGTFNYHRKRDFLGSGHLASVYRAVNPLLGNECYAIKVYDKKRTDADLSAITHEQKVAAIIAEAKEISKLNDPHIVDVIASGDSTEGPYLLMALVDGENLQSWLARHESELAADLDLRLRFAATLCRTVAKALANCHSKLGVFHGDLKPSNIILRKQWNLADVSSLALLPENTVICDFGSFRKIDARHPNASLTLTPPPYLVPEQITGDADHRTDVFQLGVLFLEIVIGTTFFRRIEPDLTGLICGPHLETPPAALADRLRNVYRDNVRFSALIDEHVSDIRLRAILHKCLQSDKKDRYSTVECLEEDLARWLGGFPLRQDTGLREGYLTRLSLLQKRCAKGSVDADQSHLWAYAFVIMAPFSFGLSFLSSLLQMQGMPATEATKNTFWPYFLVCLCVCVYVALLGRRFTGFPWIVFWMIVFLTFGAMVFRLNVAPEIGNRYATILVNDNVILKDEKAIRESLNPANTEWLHNALADVVALLMSAIAWIYLGLNRRGWRAFAYLGIPLLVACWWICPWLLERENSAWGSFFVGGTGGLVFVLYFITQSRNKPDERAFQEWTQRRSYDRTRQKSERQAIVHDHYESVSTPSQ